MSFGEAVICPCEELNCKSENPSERQMHFVALKWVNQNNLTLTWGETLWPAHRCYLDKMALMSLFKLTFSLWLNNPLRSNQQNSPGALITVLSSIWNIPLTFPCSTSIVARLWTASRWYRLIWVLLFNLITLHITLVLLRLIHVRRAPVYIS